MDFFDSLFGKYKKSSERSARVNNEESNPHDRPRDSSERANRPTNGDDLGTVNYPYQDLSRSRPSEEEFSHGISTSASYSRANTDDLDTDSKEIVLKFLRSDEHGSSAEEGGQANAFQKKPNVIDAAVDNTTQKSEEISTNKDSYDQKSKENRPTGLKSERLIHNTVDLTKCYSSVTTGTIPGNIELEKENHKREPEFKSESSRNSSSTETANKGAIKKILENSGQLVQCALEEKIQCPIETVISFENHTRKDNEQFIQQICFNLNVILENMHLFSSEALSDMLHSHLRRINDTILNYMAIIDIHTSYSPSTTDYNKENLWENSASPTFTPPRSPLKSASTSSLKSTSTSSLNSAPTSPMNLAPSSPLKSASISPFKPLSESSNKFELPNVPMHRPIRNPPVGLLDEEKLASLLPDVPQRNELRNSPWVSKNTISSLGLQPELPCSENNDSSLISFTGNVIQYPDLLPDLPGEENNNTSPVSGNILPSDALKTSLGDNQRNSQGSYKSLDPFGCDRSNYHNTLRARREAKEEPQLPTYSAQENTDYKTFLQEFNKNAKRDKDMLLKSQKVRSVGKPVIWGPYKEVNPPGGAAHKDKSRKVKPSVGLLAEHSQKQSSILEPLNVDIPWNKEPSHDHRANSRREEPSHEYIPGEELYKYLVADKSGGIYKDQTVDLRQKKIVTHEKVRTEVADKVHVGATEGAPTLPRRATFVVEPPQDSGACAVVEKLPCPVCFKKFPASEIEDHAWDCQDFGDDGAYGGF